MARVMYLECFSGAAGDMLLGALIDAGVPIGRLEQALGSLGVGHTLRLSRVMRAGIAATHVEVVSASGSDAPDGHDHDARTHGHQHGSDEPHQDHRHDHAHGHDHGHGHDHSHEQAHAHDHGHKHGHSHGSHSHRSLSDITRLIGGSALSSSGKARAVALFRRLGEAEAAIHNVPVDQIHFHEVGAIDSIIDIVGVVSAMEWLGIDDVVASPLNVGGGVVEIAHGTFPVPAPATVRLLTGVPIYSAGPRLELVTPTGALLVSAYAKGYGPTPAMSIERVGYGAGSRDLPAFPNVVRVLIGERTPAVIAPVGTSSVVKIECEIDDMSPQLFGSAVDRLFEAGALDVFLTAVQMKKGRPGTLLTALATDEARVAVCDAIFRETTTLGVRFERMSRETLDRRWVEVATTGGPVRIKVAERQGAIVNATPEFDDCVRVAAATRRSVKAVHAEAMRAWYLTEGKGQRAEGKGKGKGKGKAKGKAKGRGQRAKGKGKGRG
jgi:pyridinium-3,5-bisthiocarboxylic acid mononucleotide nickel chelatase